MRPSRLIPVHVVGLVTTSQLAGWLGVTRPTILNWGRTGRLPPPIRFNCRCYRFHVKQVREHLDRGICPTASRARKGGRP